MIRTAIPSSSTSKSWFKRYAIVLSMLLGMASTAWAVDLNDNFERADADSLGNGWIEKNAASFALQTGRVTKQPVTTGYRDNVVYRPAGEDLLDQEASIELNWQTGSIGYPQVFVRLQSDSVDQFNTLDGYILYIGDNASQAILGRQVASQFVSTLSTIFLTSPLNTTATFRLRLRATGTDPVEVSGWVEQFNGAGWQILGQAMVLDAGPDRINTPGAVGFGGYVENTYSYDNFQRLDLDGGGGGTPNPLPVTTTLIPDNADAGSADTIITVDGSDFVDSSVVRWNGNNRVTTFVSATQLTAVITAADLAAAGNSNITVFNQTPGGGESAPLTFTVNQPAGNPLPQTATLNPANAVEGGSAFVLTVTGSGFVPTSVVQWNGTDRATAFVSDTELQATIPDTDIAFPGTASVTVSSPAPGGGISNTQTFTIDPVGVVNPVPAVNGITPANVTQGGTDFALVVNGSNFVAGAVVRLNGANRATTFVNDTQLIATITAADIAAAGTAAITVFNPAPGGGLSNGATLTIEPAVVNNPVPALNNITPSNVTTGGGNFTLSVNGANFVAGAVVRFNGGDRTTTFVSGNQLTATITAADIATAGTANITVFNPAPGGGLSNGATLTIDSSGPVASQTLNSISPASVTVGDPTMSLIVYGNGFTNSSVVRLGGTDLSTTFIDSTQLSATVDAAMMASSSRSAVVVYTPQASNTVVGPITFFVLGATESLFMDDFNRPDGPDIGNGWTEKLPGAFALQNGQVVSTDTTPQGFNSNIAYRPLEEDVTDVEVAAEFIRTGDITMYPQVHSRILRDTVSLPNQLISYTAFLYDSFDQYLTITTVVGAAECYLAQFPINRELAIGERYRIRFRTVGTDPVRLTAYMDHFNVDRWETISSGTVNHDNNTQPTPGYFCNLGYMPPPNDYSGSVGFAKWFYETDNYDMFYSIRTADISPAPVVNALFPDSASAGSGGFPVIVTGNDFVLDSVVRWNGSDRPTVYVGPSRLEVQLTAADLASAGTANVTVFNPAPGGGESAPLSFTVGVPNNGFYDDFERPNGTLLGNGWLELTPTTFILSNGQVAKQAGYTDYLQNVVYRPAAENLLDVEASMELQILPTVTLPGYPQLFTRIQTDTLYSGFMDAYMLYVNDSATQVILGRQRGWSFVTPLSFISLAGELTSGRTYRMRLASTGTDPVQLQATVEMQTTVGWQILGQSSITDSSAERIATPGSVGFSGYIYDGYVFDNFLRADLTP